MLLHTRTPHGVERGEREEQRKKMVRYEETHMYWSGGVLAYFAVGVVLCSLILSVEWSASHYHALLIAYTLVGIGLVAAWATVYGSDVKSPSVLASTQISVRPEQDREYGVVYSMSLKAALMSVFVTLLFWLWFLIYLRGVKDESLQRVLDVYAVVFFPFTFFILLFSLASWWIPAAARRVCTPQYVHIRPHHHHNHSTMMSSTPSSSSSSSTELTW